MHLQIALSAVAILGAAAVALLCDFLRNKNEQLRRKVAEMQTQRPEQYPAVAVQLSPLPEAAAAYAPAVAPPAPDRAVGRLTPPEASFDQGVDLTPRRGRRRLAPPADASDPVSSSPSEDLVRRAAARAEQLAAGQTSSGQPSSGQQSLGQQSSIQQSFRTPAGSAVSKLRLVAAPSAPIPQLGAREPENALGGELTPVIVDERAWRSLLAGKAPVDQQTLYPGAARVPDLAPATAVPEELSAPRGMHTSPVLAKLLETGKPFSGLALAISVNETGPQFSPASEPVMQAASERLTALLRPQDFACRIGIKNEFVVLCPGVEGADAQRHLSRFSERLWDLRLRSLENCSILLSLGSAELRRQALSGGVALARERMRQSQRSRKTVALPAMHEQKRAV